MRVLMLCLLVAGCSVADAEFVTAPDADFEFSMKDAVPMTRPEFMPFKFRNEPVLYVFPPDPPVKMEIMHIALNGEELFAIPCNPALPECGVTDLVLCAWQGGKLYSGWPAGKCPEVKP